MGEYKCPEYSRDPANIGVRSAEGNRLWKPGKMADFKQVCFEASLRLALVWGSLTSQKIL